MNTYRIAPAKDGFLVVVTSEKNRTRFVSSFPTEIIAQRWMARRISVDNLSESDRPTDEKEP
jgi:hypothetical protein